MNADVNGALNILSKSKVVSLERLYNRGELDTPVRIRIACLSNFLNGDTKKSTRLLELCDFSRERFREINPRVQVEHGVTEAVTGIDLVKTQIKIAANEPLDFTQKDIKITGHAIECRINAEDPDQHFMPSPGRIYFMHEPSGPRVRFESAITAGLAIEPYYDSLIAKVITHGRTRGDAILIMLRALNEFIIEGETEGGDTVKTTIPLHKKILEDSYFRTGNIDTQFIKKRLPVYETIKKKLTLKEKMQLTQTLGENLTKAIDEGLDYT